MDLNKLAREASERFHIDYVNSPFDKYYMGYCEGFKAAWEALGGEIVFEEKQDKAE